MESPEANEYRIDINDVDPAGDLFIANNEEAGNLHLGKPDGAFDDADVIVESPRFRVGAQGNPGKIDANGQNVVLLGDALNIGTTLRTRGIMLGRENGGDANVNVTVKSPLLVDNAAATGGRIDAAPDGAGTRDLDIGTQASTADVEIGRNGQDVTVNGDLFIGAAAQAAGRIDAELDGVGARDLEIGGQNSTADIDIGRNGQDVNIADDLNVGGDCEITGGLQVGPGNDVAVIDADGDEDLEIGGNAGTADVIVGRDEQLVKVQGSMRVGPGDDAGLIDGNGTAVTPRDLKIGTGTITDDVVIGNASGVVDIKQTLRMNSKEVVVNDAASVSTLLTGCGLVFNSAGHSGGGPSIDFYTEGILRGWIDSNGFVNA